jgi:electron transport complex protein RnfG
MKAFLDFFKLILVLGVTCVAAAGSLSLVNQVTAKPIAEFETVKNKAAMKEVQAAATEFKALVPGKIWEAYQGTNLIGHVVKTAAPGYSGSIDIMFGVDRDRKITVMKVLTQTETPGLGARIIDPAFLAQYRGLSLDQVELKKSGGGSIGKALAGSLYAFPAAGGGGAGIDAITGATISSRAVTKGVRDGLAAFLAGDAATGAAKGAKE